MDQEYLKSAIQLSRESLKMGNFPAGAIVVKDGQIVASAVSSPYPGLLHADSKAVTDAFEQCGPLEGATLYVGLECCLMCLSVAYWAGIRDIYFAIPKSNVSSDYYETSQDVTPIIVGFHHQIRLHHVPELENEAMSVIKHWEETQK